MNVEVCATAGANWILEDLVGAFSWKLELHRFYEGESAVFFFLLRGVSTLSLSLSLSPRFNAEIEVKMQMETEISLRKVGFKIAFKIAFQSRCVGWDWATHLLDEDLVRCICPHLLTVLCFPSS